MKYLFDQPIYEDAQEPRAVEPGKNTLNIDPFPGLLSTSIDPWWARTTA
jgi:hypothetical protein